MSRWVGVVVFTGETWTGEHLSPLVYTTGAKDDQDAAMGAAMKKAAGIMRRSMMVASADNVDALRVAAANAERYGAASWIYDGTPRSCAVKVSELTDDVHL